MIRYTRATHTVNPNPETATPPAARWVWPPSSPGAPQPRLSRARFVRTVDLGAAPAEAVLALAARNRYDLRLNGAPAGTGPVRTYPEFRAFDRYDLAPHLRPGRNVIDVEIVHEDLATFHHLHEPPGFIAWGAIVEPDGGRHTLATPGAWRCRLLPGVAADAPRLSFAQGPVELVDLGCEDSAAAAWHAPAERPADEAPLPSACRPIPALTRIVVPAATLTNAAAPATARMLAARVCFDGEPRTPQVPRDRWGVALAWLHSPAEQTVEAGCWWGEFFLNGTALQPQPDASRPSRQRLVLPLRAGWNRLFAEGGVCFGYWEFCLEWPAACGLRAQGAPDDAEANECFLVAGPLTRAELERLRPGLVSGAPDAPAPDWRRAPAGPVADSPLRNLLWSDAPDAPTPARLPLRIPAGVRTRVLADLGALTLGRIAVELDAPAGTVVDAGHAEAARDDGRPVLDRTVTVYAADRWRTGAGRQRLETQAPRGFRHLELLVAGHTRDVTLRAVEAVEQRYPHRFSGTFACSDDALNLLWAYGCRTLELCSEDVLIDCPGRERTLYGGDLLPQMAATTALTRDLRLVRHSLDVLLQSHDATGGWLQAMAPFPRDVRFCSEYPLLTSIAAGWYLRLTGDDAFAARAWPVCRALAAAAERMRLPAGLYAPPFAAFIDHGRSVREGPTCAFNAALAAALEAWGETAARAGDPAASAALRARAGALRPRIVQAYYDPATRRCRDLPLGESPNGTEGMPASTWALLFVPEARVHAPAVLETLGAQLAAFDPQREHASVSPYQMFYLLGALRELGAAELAERAIRTVYAGMLAAPTGTIWETATPHASRVHAWSCGFLDYLATAVLGVRTGLTRPDEARRILVAPCAHGLKWARGVVPHPLGDVQVAWERRGGTLRVEVRTEEHATVDVRPAGPLAALKLERAR